jgi:hypothetical protein
MYSCFLFICGTCSGLFIDDFRNSCAICVTWNIC